MEAWNTIFYGGIAGQLSDADLKLLDPGLQKIVREYRRDPLRTYVQAESARNAFWDQVRQFFERYDLLLTPTVPVPAFELEHTTPGPVPGRLPEGLGWSFFTWPVNLTGQPAASLPCGFSADGLPIGLQVVGRRHADALVLSACAAFEAAAPWQGRRPALP
jgi:aspartyl-tRNA(Asn)/glutamyl-tRNA(Gln) amidotransferase subunit A